MSNFIIYSAIVLLMAVIATAFCVAWLVDKALRLDGEKDDDVHLN